MSQRPLQASHGAEQRRWTLNHPPSAADYRRRAWNRDRWHTALAVLAVATLAVLVFCLLPLPP